MIEGVGAHSIHCGPKSKKFKLFRKIGCLAEKIYREPAYRVTNVAYKKGEIPGVTILDYL